MQKKPTAAALGCLLLGGCLYLPANFQGTDRRDAVITMGEVFGIAVGSSREEARVALQHKLSAFHFIYSDCRHQDFLSDSVEYTFHHQFGPTSCPEVTEDVYHANIGLSGYANIRVDSAADRVIRVEWGRGQGYIG